MKKTGLILLLIIFSSVGFAQKQSFNKTAKIISFRVESANPGIDDRTLLLPLSKELTQLFNFSEVEMNDGGYIQWKGENPFNKFKKLNKKELLAISANPDEVLLKIEIEHRYNPVLGGLINKSRRHVMRLKVALFSSTGKRVWYHKRKDSCCIDFGVEDEDEYFYQDMDAASFLELYESVLRKTFGKD
ncbi:MAG: hypothetical protein ABJH04_13230 [Cyclobacteriaceae bacterium]